MNKRRRSKIWGVAMLAIALLLPALPTNAQNLDAEELEELRRSIDVFNGVLRESLGFNERRGVFSPRTGDVQGHYLARQGIVLEMITPLLGYRSSTSMQSLNSALEDLSSQLGSLITGGVISRPDLEEMRDAMALSLRSDEIATFYRDQMQQLSTLLDIPAVEQALASAVASANNLRNLGELDPEGMERLNQQLQDFRVQLSQRLAQADALRREIRERALQTDALPSEAIQLSWQQARDQLQAQVAALRGQIAEQTQALRERNEALEAERLAAWQQDVTALEERIFVVVCDYAAGLRVLPDGERLTLMLTGLGAYVGDGRRPDRIHVFNKADLLACQRGDITFDEMRTRALSYDF